MAASYEEVMTALRNADASGNTADAQRLAQIAASMKQAPTVPTGMSRRVGDILPNVGVGEAVLSAATGSVATPVAGIAGGIASAIPGLREGVGKDVVEGVQGALTYQPRSVVGQKTAAMAAAPFQWLANQADKAGAATTEATGSPLAGAAVNTAIQGLPVVAGALPGMIKGPAASGARGLMQSAIKPTLKDLKSGRAAAAIDTLLAEGVNPTMGGVAKLRGSISALNAEIVEAIKNSPATVNKGALYTPIKQTLDKFSKQVNPNADLAAITKAWEEFKAHPLLSGDTIPVQTAQQLKRGTYRILDKKYGQLGAAETEAQKALARGLKEEIANVVPEVAQLNARESQLITALQVAERRALMDGNKNPVGLAWLAHSPITWAAYMADKSALFKSVAARLLAASGRAVPESTTGAGVGLSAVSAEQNRARQ